MAAETETLPSLYGVWVERLLGASIPRESRATCEACAMCRPADQPAQPDDQSYFSPDSKCCTFTPALPNFLVGRILADRDAATAEGRASVSRRIAAHAAVTPLGLGRTLADEALYERPDSFGRDYALICPHFIADGGRCGIWRHREAVCATWFCKHVRGELAHDFWRLALMRLLLHLQAQLAKLCLLELDIGAEGLRALAQEQAWAGAGWPARGDRADPANDERAYAALWGNWHGREQEFYLRCAERIEALNWDEVLDLGGPEATELADLTRQAFGQLMSEDIPPALMAGKIEVVHARPETTRIKAYSPTDPVDVPNALLPALPAFDGRSNEAALAAIAARTGMGVGDDLLRTLVDFGVLKPGRR